MNPWLGWALAAAALFLGWRSYGWPGVALAFSVIVFWLLLQFNRSIRVMRTRLMRRPRQYLPGAWVIAPAGAAAAGTVVVTVISPAGS